MTTMKRMAETIAELRDAAATVIEAANWLELQFSGTEETEAPHAEQAPQTKPAEHAEQTSQTKQAEHAPHLEHAEHEERALEPKQESGVTLEQVRTVLAEKAHAGYGETVKALLKSYGANRLSEVEPRFYAELLEQAELLHG